MDRAVLATLQAHRQARRPVALVTDLTDGTQTLVTDPGNRVPPPLAGAVAAALAHGESAEIAGHFVAAFPPPLRLIAVGAVQIAQALAALCPTLDLDLTVVDPRPGWGTPERFPGISVVAADPAEALADLAPDTRTALVTLSHQTRLDDQALHAARPTPAFYLGCLGSRRTHAARLERLAAAGWPRDDLARLHGPVGLAIGARSPAEIALAIVAQIVGVQRGGAVR